MTDHVCPAVSGKLKCLLLCCCMLSVVVKRPLLLDTAADATTDVGGVCTRRGAAK